MVAKSKLMNKRKFTKLGKKSVKPGNLLKSNLKKTKKLKARPKLQKAPSSQNVDDSEQSDHGENMLDMIEEDDLQFLKNAIDNRSYSLFNKVRFSESSKKKRKLPQQDDETLETAYEVAAEGQPKVKVKALLPIKTDKGIIKRTMVEEEESQEDEIQVDDAEASDPEEEYVVADSNLDTSQPIAPAQLLLARNKLLEKKKLHIGTLSMGLLENPDEKMTNFRTLINLLNDETPEVYVTIRKLVTVAMLEVFKELLPEYQIKLQDIDNVKVKKDTLKLHKYEEALLQYYKKYLQRLEKFATALYRKRGDTRLRTQGDLTLGETAVHSMCDLLVTHPYFNFAQNLVQALIPFLNNPNRSIRLIVATAMKTVFKEDKKQDLSLKIVRVINQYVKKRSHNVNPEMLEILLALHIKDVNLDQEKESDIKQKKLRAHKANILARLSKKEAKRKKRLQALEHELLETKAEESMQSKAKNITEITKLVFGIYFRILKSSTNTKVLGVCLEGLAKFAHCINLEFYVDIVNVLDRLLAEDWVGIREKLHCIQTVFAILGGQGEALNIDPSRFYVNLYTSMLGIHADVSYAIFPVLLRTIMVGIVQRRKKITNKQICGFVKRLATLSLQLLHNGALSSLAVIKMIMQLCKAADILLDTESEMGDGRFDANVNDPEYCNAGSTALYELALLSKHYHPIVVKYAGNIAHGVPASGEGSLPVEFGKCSPEELLSGFDMSEMAFNPSIRPPTKAKGKLKQKTFHFIDPDFQEYCSALCKSQNVSGTCYIDVDI